MTLTTKNAFGFYSGNKIADTVFDFLKNIDPNAINANTAETSRQQKERFKKSLSKELPVSLGTISKLHAVFVIVGYIPFISTIKGVIIRTLLKQHAKPFLATAPAVRLEDKNFIALGTVLVKCLEKRNNYEIISCGWLLIIPDIVVTYQRHKGH